MRAENQNLQQQAMTDKLTGIFNRLAYDEKVEEVFAKMTDSGKHFGLNMLDIDKFKEYNDTYGHQAGDECLQKVAGAMKELSQQPGVWCGRYGGDEFVMIFEAMTDEEVKKVCRQLESMIYDMDIAHPGAGNNGRISVSQGVCNGIPERGETIDEYLAEADTALYAVKKNLSNRKKHQSYRVVHLPGKE